ncbi:calmodulin-4-like [Carya illinoinensis]|uniref:calmodulin-4-like n=1 Tax=Carya illinoinensis TaxID=32201 RepID=UPI001C726D83|nr:calmodulin-4-like [Carya illinoinensis]
MTRHVSKGGPLTEEQLLEILKKYDVNHDGGLSKEELKAAFQSLGARLPGWRANRALHHVDTNGDGLMFREAPLTSNQLRAIVKKYDANNDGGLYKEELKDAFCALGAHLPGWRAGLALHHADANRDGLIREEELSTLLKYALEDGYKIQ